MGHANESTTRDRYYRWVEIAKGHRRRLANSIRAKRAQRDWGGRK